MPVRRPVEETKKALRMLLMTDARGSARAMKLDDIAERLGISWREAAATIEALRAEGWLIGTSRSGKRPGAYWPITESDQVEALRAYSMAFFRMSQVYN